MVYKTTRSAIASLTRPFLNQMGFAPHKTLSYSSNGWPCFHSAVIIVFPYRPHCRSCHVRVDWWGSCLPTGSDCGQDSDGNRLLSTDISKYTGGQNVLYCGTILESAWHLMLQILLAGGQEPVREEQEWGEGKWKRCDWKRISSVMSRRKTYLQLVFVG